MTDFVPLTAAEEALLDGRLQGLRRSLDAIGAPAALEATLRERFVRHQRGARPRLWWMPPLALAATVAMATWMVRAPLSARHESAPPAAIESDPAPFLALRPMRRIALEPAAAVVETQFPRALLADWGLPVSPDRAGEPVRAEMLYSADGEPLAIRLLD